MAILSERNYAELFLRKRTRSFGEFSNYIMQYSVLNKGFRSINIPISVSSDLNQYALQEMFSNDYLIDGISILHSNATKNKTNISFSFTFCMIFFDEKKEKKEKMGYIFESV